MAKPILRGDIILFVQLRDEGFSYRKIAEKMEVDRQSVKRHVEGYDEHKEEWFKILRQKSRTNRN